MKKRLDVFLVDFCYFDTRKKAQVEIESGNIFVNGKCITKSSFLVCENDKIEIVGTFLKYVSRAGLKLEKAKNEFLLDFQNKVVLDIGASTGGFTDFCIQNGAKKVYAVDVGKNQLHQNLRQNPSVVCLESTDIRTLKTLPEEIDIAVCDVSFISLEKIVQSVSEFLGEGKEFVALIKPQFECGKEVAKKCRGVVKDEKIHKQCIEKIVNCFAGFRLECLGIVESPITGGDGNIEFLSYFIKKHSQNK